jgi:hypothetical protein
MDIQRYISILESTADALNLAYRTLSANKFIKHGNYVLSADTESSRWQLLRSLIETMRLCENQRLCVIQEWFEEEFEAERQKRKEIYAKEAKQGTEHVRITEDVIPRSEVKEMRAITIELQNLRNRISDMRKNDTKKIQLLSEQEHELSVKEWEAQKALVIKALDKVGKTRFYAEESTDEVVEMKTLIKSDFSSLLGFDDYRDENGRNLATCAVCVLSAGWGLLPNGELKHYRDETLFETKDGAREWLIHYNYLKKKQQEVEEAKSNICEELHRRLFEEPGESYPYRQEADRVQNSDEKGD